MSRHSIKTQLLLIFLIQFVFIKTFVYAQDPFIKGDFEPDTIMASHGIAWADYDKDGYPDFYVANGFMGFKQQNFLYHNNGDGTFTKITSGPPVDDLYVSNGCTWGDFDNDGDLDLYVATTVGSYDDPVINNCLYENNGDGTFTKNTTAGPAVDDREYSCAAGWGDYNNDGFVDLFIKNGFYPKQPNSLYLNNGNKTFADITNIPLVSNENATLTSKFAWGDYDNDGDLDIAIAVTDGLNSAIWRNDGNNVFTKLLNGSGGSILEGGFSSSTCWGDYDNDGDLDLFVANYGKSAPQQNFLYRNDGSDMFTKIVDGDIVNDATASLGCAWGDIDNDGDLDLFVGNDIYAKNLLYMNNGDGTFTKDTTSIVVDSSFVYGSAFADYNKDGFIDLFVSREAINVLFENNCPNNGNSNHWVDIQCVGTTSNRAGIGAKVRIKANVNSEALWQMREICAQNGYGGHDDLRAHFGLSNATMIDELIVEWPSGIVQTLTNVAVDQFLTITESNSTEMIKITAPNGGEILQPGSVYDISWSSNNTSGQLTIEYSTDGGGLWNEIVSNEPDDGSYPWTVPNTPSSNCLIRITDSDGNPFDVSDNVFTIEPATYILTMAIDPTGSGTTDPPEGDHSYTDGTVVTIIATPITGYIFNNWTGEVADPNNDTTTVTMNANKLVTAHFAQQTYTLTMVVDPEEGGTTEPASGDHDYIDGQVVTIIAEPASGYQFANWTGDVTDPNNDTTTVTMNTDKTVTANFQELEALISVTSPNGGEDWEVGTIHNITWTSENTSGNLKIEYSVDGGTNWSEIIASTEDDGSYSWTIPNDPSTNCLVRVTDTDGDPSDVSDAVFTISPISYTLTMAVNPAQGGTTDPAVGDHSYSQGTVVTIIATAATGYQFVNWTGDVADPNNDTTTVTINTNKTVTANFTLIPIVDSKASIAGENILLEWSPSLATTIYNVYRDTLYNFEPDTINGTDRIGHHISDEDPEKEGVQWTDTGNGAQIVGDVNKNYFYKVTAVTDVESAPSNVLGEFDYNLITTSSTDINVIAVIVNTKNSSTPILTAEDLVNSIPNCSDVYYWNAEGQGTVGHPKGVPFNNFNIYPGYPYIVNVTQNTVWTVAGTYSDTSFQLITTDATDINHIAVPLSKNTLTTAEELGQDIPNCSDVYYWNAEGQGTTGHVMGLPFNDFVVRAGYPYYVNVTSATVWPASGGSLLKTNSSSSNNKAVTGGSIPHTVYGELSFMDGVQAKIDQLQIKAWIAGRSSEVLTDENTGVGCDENYWWVGVGNFVTKWIVGESLHVEITAAEHGLRGTTMVLLSDAGSDKGSTINLSRTKNDLGYPLNDPPEEFALLPNYPNPFNPETYITYHLPTASQVILKIYNLLGVEVTTLVNENKEAGIYRIVWNGKDIRGREVPSGIYLVQIQAGDFKMNRKMVKVE